MPKHPLSIAYDIGWDLGLERQDLANLLQGLEHGSGPLAEATALNMTDRCQFAAFLRGFADGLARG